MLAQQHSDILPRPSSNVLFPDLPFPEHELLPESPIDQMIYERTRDICCWWRAASAFRVLLRRDSSPSQADQTFRNRDPTFQGITINPGIYFTFEISSIIRSWGVALIGSPNYHDTTLLHDVSPTTVWTDFVLHSTCHVLRCVFTHCVCQLEPPSPSSNQHTVARPG